MAHLPRPLLIVAAQVLAAIGVIAAVLLGVGLDSRSSRSPRRWLLYFAQNRGTEGSDHIRMIVAVSLAIGVLTGAEEDGPRVHRAAGDARLLRRRRQGVRP